MSIELIEVCNLEQALKSAGLPLATDVNKIVASEKRGKKLGSAPSGSGHDKFLRGIIVSFRLRMPRYFYQQLDTYHFIESISSQSTMHCITKFDLRDMFEEHTDPVIKERFIQLVQAYKDGRVGFDVVKSSLPEGLLLYRDCVTNYQQLKTIYFQRKDHRLPEWRKFCEWCLTLPMFKELIGGE